MWEAQHKFTFIFLLNHLSREIVYVNDNSNSSNSNYREKEASVLRLQKVPWEYSVVYNTTTNFGLISIIMNNLNVLFLSRWLFATLEVFSVHYEYNRVIA